MATPGTSDPEAAAAAGAAEIVDYNSDQLPETFLKMLIENSSAIENGFDLLVMVYHGLMLESGFGHDCDVFKHCDEPKSVKFKYWLTRDPQKRPICIVHLTKLHTAAVGFGEHSFKKRCPGRGANLGSFWIFVFYSHNCSALDHSAAMGEFADGHTSSTKVEPVLNVIKQLRP